MEWKIITNYQNYSVSDTGIVKNNKTNRLLKPCINKDGYLKIGLYNVNNKSQIKMYVHRLVAQMFILNSNLLEQVDHIDRNPLNNNINNLRWVNPKENINN